MKFEHTNTMNFENALRGMRNPKESYHLLDSLEYDGDTTSYDKGFSMGEDTPMEIYIGPNDMNLALRLIKAGTEHRKFLRQIFVSVDITAPLYIWKEFDTYKVGTTANSTSTMHKLATTPITFDCFEKDDFCGIYNPLHLIDELEQLRKTYLLTKDVRYWKELIRWLPESWLQTRTVTMNYENLLNIYFQRKNHKLTEWHTFCNWIKTLPYMSIFISALEK